MAGRISSAKRNKSSQQITSDSVSPRTASPARSITPDKVLDITDSKISRTAKNNFERIVTAADSFKLQHSDYLAVIEDVARILAGLNEFEPTEVINLYFSYYFISFS